jgi:hypothetical protein
LRGYPGPCEVQLVICLADGTRVVCPCEKIRVENHPEMRARLEDLVGPGNFRLLPQLRPGNGNGRQEGRSRNRSL